MQTRLAAFFTLACLGWLTAASEPLSIPQILGDPDFYLPKLTADGSKLALVAASERKKILSVLDLASLQPRAVATFDTTKLVNVWWKGNDLLLLLVGNPNGSRDFRFFDLRTGKGGSLLPTYYPDFMLVHPLPDDPEHILFQSAASQGVDLRRINVRTGKMSLVEADPGGVTRWILNARGEVVAAAGHREHQTFLLWRAHAGAEWQRIELGPELKPDLKVIALHPDQRRILLWKFAADGPSSVVALDPTSMTQEEIFHHPAVEADGVAVWGDNAPASRAILYETDRPQWRYFDPADEKIQSSVDAVLPDTVNFIFSASKDAAIIVIWAYNDHDPGTFYLLDRAHKRLNRLGAAYHGLDPNALGRTQPFEFSNRDGLPLHGRLTLPSPETKSPPLVVIVDANSFADLRARYGFHDVDQILATRGYAVARIDCRGAGGYGRAFSHAGDYQLNQGMPDDIEDGVRWLADRGLIDRNRIGLMGINWGGLIAIHALKRSNLYRVWVNLDTPMTVDELPFERFAATPGTPSEALAALGGPRAAEQYRKSVDPKPLVAQIALPAFHGYGLSENQNDISLSGKIVQSLVRKSAPAPIFAALKPSDDQNDLRQQSIQLQQKMVEFLELNLKRAEPAASK